MEEAPIVMPDGPWFAANTVAYVNTLFDGDPASWRYGTTYVHDERTDAQRRRVIDLGQTASTTVAVDDPASQFIGQTRAVVGSPNIGEIRLGLGAGPAARPEKVVHTLHWWMPDYRRATTVHEAPLTVPLQSELPATAYR